VPRRDFPRFLELYRKGDPQLEPMITARIALEDVNEALAAMAQGEGARSVIMFGLDSDFLKDDRVRVASRRGGRS
jgi:Zn-dependent alcohol dehydrogenase